VLFLFFEDPFRYSKIKKIGSYEILLDPNLSFEVFSTKGQIDSLIFKNKDLIIKNLLGNPDRCQLLQWIYFDNTPDRRSWKAFIGSEANLYDIGDLNILTQITAYSNFMERSRFRTDFKIDLKHDFPKDIYIYLCATLNYDNLPIEGTTALD